MSARRVYSGDINQVHNDFISPDKHTAPFFLQSLRQSHFGCFKRTLKEISVDLLNKQKSQVAEAE